MPLEIFEMDQGSEIWLKTRLGLPTASKFATVIAKGKDGGTSLTRSEYMRKLAGEILTGEPMDSYTNGFMERGRELEDQARQKYAFVQCVDIRRVGFLKNGPKGASPDSLIGNSGGLEVKIALPHIQIERLERGTLPPEHKAQVQGNIWVAEREWWDFVSDCPRLPQLTVRVHRDDAYIATMAKAIDAFNEELAEMVERIHNYGDPDRLRRQLIESNAYVQNVSAG